MGRIDVLSLVALRAVAQLDVADLVGDEKGIVEVRAVDRSSFTADAKLISK